MRGEVRIIGITALSLSLACASDQVTIPVEEWALSATPSVSIGVMEGDSVYLFQRIADAAFTTDGRIVVADGGLSVVRMYDSDGTFLWQAGRRGDGPGEFQYLRNAWVIAPDTVGVWDLASQRLTFFDGHGALVRTVRVDQSGEGAGVGHLDFVVGGMQDGSTAIASLGFGGSDHLSPDRVSIERFSATGAHLGRLGESTGFVRARLSDELSGPIPFSPYPHFASDGKSVYHTDGYRPSVTVWSGSEERTIEFPPSNQDLEFAWTALEKELRNRGSELYLRNLPTTPRPDSIPSLAGLVIDDVGRVWAKQYDPRTDALWLGRALGGAWWVSDVTGTVIAKVAMPNGFAPLHVDGDRVIGIAVDPLGVERVEVRTIAN